MQNTKPSDVMNMEELAELLRITETTAYQLVRSGEIPGRKVGREWRFVRTQVLEWLQRNDQNEKEKDMDHIVQRDEWGGEYTVINGEEKIALWIPMSLKEKQALMAKAVSENVKVSELVANYLKSWIKGA